MIIKGDKNYILQLSELWYEVFDDDKEYIDIFFEYEYSRCETLISETDGKVVSALYLLPCEINWNNETFHGRYLYAAATKKEYRGQGIMAKLIKQAIDFCEKNELDFIALLPADEGLYTYYSRYGFDSAMYKYETTIESSRKSEVICIPHKTINGDALKNIRCQYTGNALIFPSEELNYIIESMKSYGCEFRYNQNGYIAFNKDDSQVEELICCDTDYIETLLPEAEHAVKVFSPYDLSKYGKTKKLKFGMVCPLNYKLKNCSDIYMNLALD